MKQQSFTIPAHRYARIYYWGRLMEAAIRWAPVGLILGTAVRFFAESDGLFPAWTAFVAVLVPSVAAAAAVVFSFQGISGALSWLDGAVGGRQELQAAWECRDSNSELSGLVRSAGERFFKNLGNKPPRPRPGTTSVLLSLASAAIFLLMLMAGRTLFEPPPPDFAERGAEMEAWAESWAERADGTGRPESRELAGRMGELGRSMADGSMGERQAERALKELEGEIEKRRDALVRDKLAENLVEEMGIDRESAEMFRVQHRRLPSEVLAELGRAAEGSPAISEMSRDMIDKLLSDPDFRDRLGNGTPELSEELTEALKDSFDSRDPGINELDEAVIRSRKARGGEEIPKEGEDESREGRQGGRGSGAGDSGENSGSGDGSEESDKDGGRTGGSGRSSTAVEDEISESSFRSLSTAKEPLHLPMDSERTGTWRTVIRAYTEDGDTATTQDTDVAAEWRQEVESVIRREDIPPRTRDYVRDYFLALEEGPEYEEEEE